MYGVHVRVKPEVEELVREFAEKLGYEAYTIRNTAILLGLMVLSCGQMPKTDEEFLKLLGKVKVVLSEEEG